MKRTSHAIFIALLALTLFTSFFVDSEAQAQRRRGPLGRAGGSEMANAELARRYGQITQDCLEKHGRSLLARAPADTGNWCAKPGTSKNLWSSVILGIISNESHGNPRVVGDHGNSLGLMQIQPRWHVHGRYAACRGIVRSSSELFIPEKNICCGIAIMARQQASSRTRSIASIVRPWSVTFDAKAGRTRRNSQNICMSHLPRVTGKQAATVRGLE